MARQAALIDFHSGPAAVDWERMAAHARSMHRARAVALYAFLIAVSLPIILPYFWLVTIAFSAKTGVAETMVLWRSMLVLIPAVIAFWLAAMLARNRLRMWLGTGAVGLRRGRCIHPAGRSRPAPAQFHIPGGAGFRIGCALPSRSCARRSAVPQCLACLWQFAADRRGADGHRRDRRIARRLLPVALAISRARRDAALAAGAARLPGADAGRPDVPDALLDRAPGYALRRHSCTRRLRAALCDLYLKGLFRRRAVGHRDECAYGRRIAAPGLPTGGTSAGQERAPRHISLHLYPRLGGVHLRLYLPHPEHQLDDEPLHVLRAR